MQILPRFEIGRIIAQANSQDVINCICSDENLVPSSVHVNLVGAKFLGRI